MEGVGLQPCIKETASPTPQQGILESCWKVLGLGAQNAFIQDHARHFPRNLWLDAMYALLLGAEPHSFVPAEMSQISPGGQGLQAEIPVSLGLEVSEVWGVGFSLQFLHPETCVMKP